MKLLIFLLIFPLALVGDFELDLLLLEDALNTLTKAIKPSKFITKCTSEGLKEVLKINEEFKAILKNLLQDKKINELTPTEWEQLDKELQRIWCGSGFTQYWEKQAI
ncbi:MAG: hypothetical protein WA432_00315 [Candidatus Babeliaceae bacterium]